jgi:hypothetical protein
MRKLSLSFALACLCLSFSGCSSTIKVELWAKRHPDAALAMGVYATSHPDEASLLFKLDCSNRREFKNQITNALKHSTMSEPDTSISLCPWIRRGQSVYMIDGQIQYYGFISWCNKYPKAAKSLRHHAKALCKAGTGILENYKMK